ncbi:MAG: GNAT family N-acetyltransferase [Bacilli bacterium]|nr:GNAT family N-acetyltransferase [Bacilli bacterium]
MKELYILEDKYMTDFSKIDEYNKDFHDNFPDWKPFVTKENFENFLKEVEEKKQGIGNDGVKEIFYWFMEGDKIIGAGGIRLNPEVDERTKIYCGHIFYQIVPSKRKQGYGTILCHLLLKKMQELGFKEAIITCFDTNKGSIKIIEQNSGEFIEKIYDIEEKNERFKITRRYKVNIEKSLKNFKSKRR